MRTQGRLIALFAAAALSSTRLFAQDASAQTLPYAPEAQVEAFQQATIEGEAGLIAFMERFPNSVLIPAVIEALAEITSVEHAVQAALNAGVDTAVVFAVASQLSPEFSSAVGLAIPGAPLSENMDSNGGSDNDGSERFTQY